MAEGDLFLCPTVRLLADRPGVSTFAYDGSGHRLVLPDRGHLDEPLPLLIVGAGATLRLRNVTIVNKDHVEEADRPELGFYIRNGIVATHIEDMFSKI